MAKVLVDIPTKSLGQQLFDYIVPETLESRVTVGSRVLLPFNGRLLQGFILDLFPESEFQELKEIKGVTEDEPLLSQELITVARWISETYMSPLSLSIRAMLPSGISIKGTRQAEALVDTASINDVLSQHFTRSSLLAARDIVDRLADGPRTIEELTQSGVNKDKVNRILNKLVDLGFIRIKEVWLKPKVNPKMERLLFSGVSVPELLSRGEKLTEVQGRALAVITETESGLTLAECCRICKCTPGVVKRLVEKGYARFETVRVMRRPKSGFEAKSVYLTIEQETALDRIIHAIDSRESNAFLLKGVTGSGKTEVYLRAIEKVIAKGRQAIVLVPEIALTPQTTARFKGRFGDDVAVFHSRLSPGEKYDEWVRIRTGQVSVAVGARSAIFAPFSDLGLIVVDEEHEGSYKQDDDPKYHAVDVARFRSQLLGVPLILGSATPSIESSYLASKGDYTLLELKERVDSKALPPVSVIDMREELKRGNKSIFSRELQTKLESILVNGEQAVIFLNRRGFNTFVMCRECGKVMECPNCDVSLTFHASPPILQCHYCNTTVPVPINCPDCGSRYIRYFGTGTQRVEAELSTLYPHARLVRMDVDTTTGKDAHSRLLGIFARGEADILIGTQMVAKGLDFPNVTLVGVIAADTSLNLPDYKAAERTFQLLTQVAGRAGRGEKPGTVVVQTYNPEHYAVQCASRHDYDAFYTYEIALRNSMGYPPFMEMAQVVISGTDESAVINLGHQAADQLKANIDAFGAQVLGPAPAPLSKVEGRYRWQLVIKAGTLNELINMLSCLDRSKLIVGDCRLGITIRPANLL